MMKEQWQAYSDKFLSITPREQYLIILTGLVAIIFIFFTLAIDEHLIANDKLTKQIRSVTLTNKSATTTIEVLEEALTKDPNVVIKKQLQRYHEKMAEVDQDLLALTSGLINPIQMRYALIDLLKLQKGVSLLSFEVIKAQPLTVPATTNTKETEGVTVNDSDALTLYKHGIKLKIKGNYFQLRDYLIQLEQLEWTFFWQTFDYQLIQYPNSELIIEMYSLSTHKEFIGV